MRVAVVATAICLALVGLASGDDAKAVIRKQTDIPAQGLGPALQALAQDGDFQVVCRADLVKDLHTPGISGEFTPGEALARLLNGTGLTYQYIDDKTVTIVPATALTPSNATNAFSSDQARAGEDSGAKDTASDEDQKASRSFWDRFRVARVDQGNSTGDSTAVDQNENDSSRQNEKNQSLKLEEIVITSQKRTERMSDVTVAAAVIGAATLENSNVESISDLNRLVPSVSISGTTNSRAPMGIRGISSISNQAAVGIVSGVEVLIDGIPISSDSFAMKHLDDLQRIEVLKGPQSTLGGRSAAQGVINIVTRQPSATWTGSASGTVTNDDEQRLNAFIAGPIVPGNLDFSVAAYGNSTRLPITNVFYDTHTREHTYGVHAKLRFKPTDNLNILLAAGLAHDNSYGFNLTYAYVTPGATILNSGTLGVPQLLPGITPSFANQTQNSPVPNAGSSAIDNDVSLNVDYTIGEYTLSSTTSLQRDKQDVVNDLFTVSQYFLDVLTHGASHYDNTQRLDKKINQTSEELKLVSPAEGAFNYIAGMYYARTTADESTLRAFPSNPVIYSVAAGTATYDLYARTTWKFWRDLSLVTGLRYNYDDISYNMNQVANAANGPHQSAASDGSSTVVGDISLKKQLTDDAMVYATSALGYSPRAYNTAATLTSNVPIDPVRKTRIYHNEIGLKGAYFERRASLNVAVFDTFYRDFQVQTFDVPPGSTVSSPKLDSGDARTTGIELDTAVEASSNLRLSLNMAYIDARFTTYLNAPCYAYPRGTPAPGCHIDVRTKQSVQDVSGQPMPNAPKLKFVIGAEQRIPLDAISYDLLLTGSYSHQGSAQMLPDENPQAIVPAFGLLNLSSTLARKSGAYSVTLFCNNVLDHHYPSYVADSWNNVWAANVVTSQPARDSNRYWGLRFNASF